MSIRTDFSQYVDGNGLNTPAPGAWSLGQSGSDNGTMFTSEYYIMLKKNGQLIDQDKLDYAQKIGQCVNLQGMLNRVPVGQNDGQEEVDNYYAACSGCKTLGNTEIPRKFLWAIFRYLGFMDNANPGTLWVWNSFMPRQPQMIAAMIAAAFPSFRNPLHFCIRLLAMPLFFVAALVIATSCINAPASNTDDRRLSWHLIQAVSPVSLMCWLASKIWMRRLYKVYLNGMQGVASLYYHPQPDNPYSKWWITR